MLLMADVMSGTDMLMAAITALVIGSVAQWIRSRRHHLTLWSRQGVPGPPPQLVFGNLLDYLRHASPSVAQHEWITRYTDGRSTHNATVGFFMGGIPALVTTDLKLLARIFITDSASFADRARLVPGLNAFNEWSANLGFPFCPPERYAEMRRTVNKCFTPAKLRGNVPFMRAALDILIGKLKKATAESESGDGRQTEVELTTLFGLFTADVIARTAFGLDDPTLQQAGDQDDGRQEATIKPRVLQACDQLARGRVRDPFLIGAVLFPGASNMLIKPLLSLTYLLLDWFLPFYSNRLQPYRYVSRYLQHVVQARDEQKQEAAGQGNVRLDLLQALMEARNSGEEAARLSDAEVGANGAIMYAAGYETTTTTLSFIMHYLINDQDLQDRLRDEAVQLLIDDGELGYNTLQKLPLCGATVREALRLHPPGPQIVMRDALVNYVYQPPPGTSIKSPITIPRGTTIVAAVNLLHRDPTYWGESADTFRVDRFLRDETTGERLASRINQLVYLPFGAGIHSCVGQQFGLLTVKLTLASLLIHYRFVPCARTYCGPVVHDESKLVQKPAHDIWAHIEEVSIR